MSKVPANMTYFDFGHCKNKTLCQVRNGTWLHSRLLMVRHIWDYKDINFDYRSLNHISVIFYEYI